MDHQHRETGVRQRARALLQQLDIAHQDRFFTNQANLKEVIEVLRVCAEQADG